MRVVLLLPFQLTKVWSDQNGDTCGDVSGINYFTNDNLPGTDHAGHQRKNYMMMGFRQDGKGHAKASLYVPGMPDAIKNKLVVQFAVSSGGVVFPEGGIATVANGNLTTGTDPGTMTATLIWDDKDPNNGDLVSGDWMVIAGIDQNGDGKLQASEIASQTTHVIREIPSVTYEASKVQLGACRRRMEFGSPKGGLFYASISS